MRHRLRHRGRVSHRHEKTDQKQGQKYTDMADCFWHVVVPFIRKTLKITVQNTTRQSTRETNTHASAYQKHVYRLQGVSAGCLTPPSPLVIPKAFLDFAVAKGADRQTLLDRSSIASADLSDLDKRIPLSNYV